MQTSASSTRETSVQPNRGFRKFFENCLDRTGLDHHMKLRLEGHSAGTRDAYTSRDIEELRKPYQQAYQCLDLSEEAAADSRLKDLEKSLAEKTLHIEALKKELSEQRRLEVFVRELMANPEIQRILKRGKE